MKRIPKGQSILEVLIGIAIGAVLIIAAAGAIAPALRTNTRVNQVQAETQISKEMADNVRAWVQGGWKSIAGLATGSANIYYMVASSSPFTTATGTESVTISGSNYVRYFYLSDVYRDSNGYVTTTVSGNNYDPSTKQVTVGVNAATSTTATTTFVFYVSRYGDNTFGQTDWSSGPGTNGPTTLVNTSYATSSKSSNSSTNGIHYVQSSIGLSSTVNTVTTTLPLTPTANDLVIVAIATFTNTVTSVTDNASNTYTPATNGTKNSISLYVYYAQNIVSTSSLLITAHLSGSNGASMIAEEVTSAATASALDQKKTGTGTSKTSTSGSVTTTTSTELLFGAETDTDNAVGRVATSSGWVELAVQPDNSTYNFLVISNKVITSTSSVSAQFDTTTNDSADWVAAIATFVGGTQSTSTLKDDILYNNPVGSIKINL